MSNSKIVKSDEIQENSIDENLEATQIQKVLTQGSLNTKRDHITLQLGLNTQASTYLCKKIGNLGNDHLLVAHPTLKNELAPLRLSQDV